MIIRIGAIDYKLEPWPAADADKDKCCGDIDHNLERIRIRVGMSYEATLETLLHEAIHGMWTQSALTLCKRATEEQVATVVAQGLVCLIRDNEIRQAVEALSGT